MQSKLEGMMAKLYQSKNWFRELLIVHKNMRLVIYFDPDSQGGDLFKATFYNYDNTYIDMSEYRELNYESVAEILLYNVFADNKKLNEYFRFGLKFSDVFTSAGKLKP